MKVSEMDLLDYFAAQALSTTPKSDSYYFGSGSKEAKKVAESAYEVAEAMMAERQKRKKAPI